MSDADSDEELNRAIALSLQEPSPPNIKGSSEVIDLVSDEDDDGDLDAPMIVRNIPSPGKTNRKADIGSKGPGTVDLTQNEQQSEVSPGKAIEVGSATFEQSIPVRNQPRAEGGILGLLNRKQMEEERLARAKQRLQRTEASNSTKAPEPRKRKASRSPEGSVLRGRPTMAEPSRAPLVFKELQQGNMVPAVHPSSSSNTIDTRSPFHGTPTLVSRSTSSSQQTRGPHQQPSLGQSHQTIQPDVLSYRDQQSTSGIQYPDGVVKKTWANGHPRQGDDIKIEEVFQKADLELAVLSAFQVDPEWVQTKLDDKTKVIWALQAKTQEEKDNIRSHAPSNYRFCFPPMEGNVNCMHSKLQLLAHPTHLRIVVPSANLVPYDWGESGVMENTCFLIDLPRHLKDKITEDSDLTFFATELIYFLEKMGLGQGTINSVKQFDFSRTAHLAFIHSIGGSHHGSDWKRTGFCGLGTAVRKLGLRTGKRLSANFLTASLGNLNNSFMKSMFLALKGDDGMTEYTWRYSKPIKGQGSTGSLAERKLLEDLKSTCQIYFPTRQTVEISTGGAGAGGTICFNSKWYHAEEFPRQLMRDCRSHRQGMLMHNKMIFVRPHDAPSGGVAWAYIGSANLSESAWGRLVRDKSTKEPKINCRNWECGVIVPISASDKAESDAQHQGPPGMEVFQDHVPVPMVVPGDEYAGRWPWFNNEMGLYPHY